MLISTHFAALAQSDYELFGVSPDAEFLEIRAAYLDKIKKFHPDLNPDVSSEPLQKFNAAYDRIRLELKIQNRIPPRSPTKMRFGFNSQTMEMERPAFLLYHEQLKIRIHDLDIHQIISFQNKDWLEFIKTVWPFYRAFTPREKAIFGRTLILFSENQKSFDAILLNILIGKAMISEGNEPTQNLVHQEIKNTLRMKRRIPSLKDEPWLALLHSHFSYIEKNSTDAPIKQKPKACLFDEKV